MRRLLVAALLAVATQARAQVLPYSNFVAANLASVPGQFVGPFSAASGAFALDASGDVIAIGTFNAAIVGNSYILAHAALATDYNTTSPGASPGSIQFARNCNSLGSACIINAGDTGTTQGFAFYQMPSSNVWASATLTGYADKSGDWTFPGTLASAPLTVTDPSSAASMTVNATGNGNGATLKLTGNGGTTPSKTLRVTGGIFDILSNSGAELLRVDDAANLTLYYAGGLYMSGSGKVNLDASGTLWVQEVSGNVVIGTGTTRLFSINGTSGNVIAKGTVTASGTP